MKKLLLKREIKIREENFGFLVFNPFTFNTSQINRTGKQILDLCNGEHTLSDILSFVNPDNADLVKSIRFFIENMILVGIVKQINDYE